MKSSMSKVGALIVLALCMVPAGRTQSDKKGKSQKGNSSLSEEAKPGDVAPGGPTVSKDELNAYKAIYNLHGSDPDKLAELGEAFVVKYPDSQFAGAVYSELASSYLATSQPDKMLVAGSKALDKNPDNVDVLPLMAWAIPRRSNPGTADGAQQIQKAQGWAHHGIDLLATMPKPTEMDDAAFSKAKNDKLALCHDGLGVAAAKTGKYEEAISELTQSLQLSSTPDPVDYYLLGISNEQASHFSDAVAAFTKCAAEGPMQAQCKGLLDETKKKASTSLEAPK